MKRILQWTLAVASCALAAGAVQAATSVGVSIGINQPGVYGRINIGDYPPPAVIYPQPVVISQPRVVVQRQPIYLYVPPPHQRDWRRYCDRYAACGQPVYFVKEDWVRERYVRAHPNWRDGRRDGVRESRYDERRDGDRRYDDRKRHHDDDRRGDGRGNGHGNGKGHRD